MEANEQFFTLPDAWDPANASIPRSGFEELIDDLLDRMRQAGQDAILRVLNDVTREAIEHGMVNEDSAAQFDDVWALAFADALDALELLAIDLKRLADGREIPRLKMLVLRCLKCGASAEGPTTRLACNGDIVAETYIRANPDSEWEIIDSGLPYSNPPRPRPRLRRVK